MPHSSTGWQPILAQSLPWRKRLRTHNMSILQLCAWEGCGTQQGYVKHMLIFYFHHLHPLQRWRLWIDWSMCLKTLLKSAKTFVPRSNQQKHSYQDRINKNIRTKIESTKTFVPRSNQQKHSYQDRINKNIRTKIESTKTFVPRSNQQKHLYQDQIFYFSSITQAYTWPLLQLPKESKNCPS